MEPTLTGRIWAVLTWQRVPASDMPVAEPRREAAVLTGLWALHVVAALCAGLLIRTTPLRIAHATDWLQDWWYAGAFKLALMLVLTLAVMRRWRVRIADVLAGWRPTLDAWLIVGTAFAVGFSINLGRIKDIHAALGSLHPAESAARIAGGLALALFTAAIPEELFYRGLMQTRFERVMGRFPAVLLTAVLFTSWHLPSRYVMSNGVEGTAGDFVSVLQGTGGPVFIIALILG